MTESQPSALFGLPTAASPRAAALYCCANMSSSFGPPAWPLYTRTGSHDTGQHLPEQEQRAGYAYLVASVLRGAFWAHRELTRCARTPLPAAPMLRVVRNPDADEPESAAEQAPEPRKDEEAIAMLAALVRYLSDTWGVVDVPTSYREGDDVARGVGWVIARKQIWFDEYRKPWPVKAAQPQAGWR